MKSFYNNLKIYYLKQNKESYIRSTSIFLLMEFHPENLYHVYNRGNQQQILFFERANYLFFLKKVRKELLPYTEIINYCLMPNHFHFLLYSKLN